MPLQEKKNEFAKYLETIQAIREALTLLSFDSATGAPAGGKALRARTISILSGQMYGFTQSEQMGDFLAYFENNQNDLDELTLCLYQKCKKTYDKNNKIPRDFIQEYSKLTSTSQRVWEQAKTTNDYEMFAPYLDQVIQGKKRMADYMVDDNSPYDALLDDYEEGLTSKTLDAYFLKMRENIVPLLKKIQASPKKIDDSFLTYPVPIETQRKIANLAMEVVGYDLNCGQLRESVHPFSTTFNKFDCRITTNYHENLHTAALFSVLHESGHAIYEQGCGDDIVGTILDRGTSTGIHESQSRFYENYIGRSRAFIDSIFDRLSVLLGPHFKDVTPAMYYEAVNRVKPSFIRIEADELTYSLHIMLRYEMEKAFINGDYALNKLPQIWNEMVYDYLGIEVKSNAEGILQDMHWGVGMMGYFPGYSIGSAYGAQFLFHMQKDLDVYGLVGKGDIKTITNWLGNKIHLYGSKKTSNAIILGACGEEFNSDYYIKYLSNKYTQLYEL